MQDLVSVIITVYNSQDYISECLQSIINQTYKNLEIICIEDCGNDNSITIIEKYIQNDNRIKLIKHKENRGCGGARNTGISNANGKYIYFIDGDDFIENNYIENLVNTIEKYNTDIVCNSKMLKYYKNNENKNCYIKNENDFILNKVFDFDENIVRKIMTSALCKIYKTDFLKNNNLYFPEKLKFEDFAFLHILKTQAKNVVFTYDSTYFYRQREGSLIHQYKTKGDDFESIEAIKYIYDFYKTNDLLDKYTIPFAWLKKFFKRQEDKNRYFIALKNDLLQISGDILQNRNIYSKKDFVFFDSVLKSKNYLMFRILYTIRRLLKI